jgi:CRISPR-associated protein (TIGR02584 family)
MPSKKTVAARDHARAASASTRTVLVATTGLTPAVLTETVWALAQESPPVIPDTIVVLTTSTGRLRIEQQLFGPDEIWQQLRVAILGKKAAADPRLDFDNTPDRVKVVHHRADGRRVPLDELATPAQNTAFADAITQELWTHTSQPDTRVVASLAGGFKTMSALMLSAMQLMANPGDRVTHVLVSGGYENTTPPFFFPAQKIQKLKTLDGRALLAADARIQLIDVPLIPLRRWFADALDRQPPSYETLVASSIESLEAHASDLTLALGPVKIPDCESKHWIRLNGAEHRLSPDRYVYLRFFAERLRAGEPPCPKLADTIDELEEWLSGHKDTEPRLHRMLEALSSDNPKRLDADDLPKRLKDFRTFLEKLPGGRALAAALPAKGHWGLKIPKERIALH